MNDDEITKRLYKHIENPIGAMYDPLLVDASLFDILSFFGVLVRPEKEKSNVIQFPKRGSKND